MLVASRGVSWVVCSVGVKDELMVGSMAEY